MWLNFSSENDNVQVTTKGPIVQWAIWDRSGRYQKWDKYSRKNYVECVTCKRHQGLHYSHLDALPLLELQATQLESEPFQFTGVDYIISLKVNLNKQTISKAYVVLFTCTVTRACHLELMTYLPNPGFLYAFRRFTSRQCFSHLMSDNDTTFAAKYSTVLNTISK